MLTQVTSFLPKMVSILKKNSKLIGFGIIVLFANLCQSQDVGFPERGDEEESKQNAAKRKPIYIPGRCRENELLYPGDQLDDWICDCSPGHLFHPATDKCYSAYRKGPCSEGSYLILPKDKAIPECQINPCERDGNVRVRNECYSLGQPGPCPFPELSNVLGVNTTTLELACVSLSVVLNTRFDDDDDKTQTPAPTPADINLDEAPLCAKGCKRYINGTCPTVDEVTTTSKPLIHNRIITTLKSNL